MIRDSKNKEILFFGVVYEPDQYKERVCEQKGLIYEKEEN